MHDMYLDDRGNKTRRMVDGTSPWQCRDRWPDSSPDARSSIQAVIRLLIADSCRLTVTHDQFREGANEELYGGWPLVLSGLKTLLETGETLTTPASLMYVTSTA